MTAPYCASVLQADGVLEHHSSRLKEHGSRERLGGRCSRLSKKNEAECRAFFLLSTEGRPTARSDVPCSFSQTEFLLTF